jgi:hypothetical protein
MVAPRRIVCVLAALTFASACGTTPTDTKLPLINTPATTSSTTSTWTYTPPTSSTTTSTTSTTSTTTAEPPQVAVPPAPEPPETTTQAPAAAYYKNCDSARAAGAAPLHRGDPGYRAGLDRDKDGVACE